MADRAEVNVVQKLIGRAFSPAINAQSDDPNVGAVNAWGALRSSIVGSMDWYHKVGFILRNNYAQDHPLFFDGLSDAIDFGYINADLTTVGKNSHIWISGWFDLNWPPCPTGEEDYPSWDGWPTLNDALPDYPENSGSRVPIFEKAQMVRAERSVGSGTISHDNNFKVYVTRPYEEVVSTSSIWVYRFPSATEDATQGQWVPSGTPIATPVTYDANEQYIQVDVGPSGSYDLPDDEPRFYVIYWQTPEYTYISGLSQPSPSGGSDVTSSLTITSGEVRELFDGNRYDFVDFEDDGRHYIKHPSSMRYEMLDGDDEYSDEENPLFYRLPALQGSLDSSVSADDELPGGGYDYVGNVWGYGYSIDMGSGNPSDRDCVVPIIICYQPRAGETTLLQVVRGPIVPSEFHVADWNDFEYWPPTPEGFELFAKLIVKQMPADRDAAYRPESYVLHVDHMDSYGRKMFPNSDYITNMISVISENGQFSMNLENATTEGVRLLLWLTPYTSRRMMGLMDEASFFLDPENAAVVNSYWRIPFLHPDTKTEDQTISTVLEHIETSGVGYAEHLEMHRGLRDTVATLFDNQLSVQLASFNADSTASDGGLIVVDGEPGMIASNIEFFFPADGGCLEHSTPDKLKHDYTVRMYLYSQEMNRIRKDLNLAASRYWITNREAQERLNDGLRRDQYIWPSKLDQIYQWQLYGRTTYIPDAKGGETHGVSMRPFDPDDPNLLTLEEFRAAKEEEYADALNSTDPTRVARAEEAILNAITDQEYMYGGFDTVDLDTLTDEFIGMDKMVMGVTMYNDTGIATWQASSRQWGGDHPDVDLFDGISGLPRARYGYTIDGSWMFQDFDETDVQTSRQTYVNEHPQESNLMKQQINDDAGDNDDFALDGTSATLSTTFTADFTDLATEIYTVDLKLRIVGAPTGTIVLSINSTDTSTKVPGSVLQVSEEIDVEDITDEFTWTEFTFKRPSELSSATRYSLNLTTTDPEGDNSTFDADNRVEWAYSDRDLHSYGATTTNDLLAAAIEIGDDEITLQDASGFSSSGHVQVDAEVLQFSGVSGNILQLSSTATEAHAVGSLVYEVTYVASDSEVRWRLDRQENDVYDWITPSDPAYDGTYQLWKKTTNISLVREVPVGEWAGSDIRVTDSTSDSFYIAATGSSYDTDFEDDDMYMYGYVEGLDPLAGFNVPSTYDFPPMNDLRVHSSNVTDGYVGWTSERLDEPSTLTIYPLARIVGGAVTYIPTENDMYVTAVCRKWDDTLVAVNIWLGAGFSSPVLLSSDEFVSVEMLWVDDEEFQEAPFYGYDASERFVVRTK